MSKTKSYHSLRVRLALAFLAPLMIVLAVFSYAEYRNHRRLLLDNLHLTATSAGQIIEGSLQHAMQTNDLSAVQQTIRDIAKQPDVQGLMLLDKRGQVVWAADANMIGRQIDPTDPTCQACHQYPIAIQNESVVLNDPQRGAFFRNANVLENETGCQTCHGTQDPVLGVLLSDFSMAPVERQLVAYGRTRLLWSGGSIVVTLLIAGLIIDRTIIAKLKQFTRAIGNVTKGDLETRLEVDTPDELGVLATTFNRMADGLQEKRRLEENLAEQALTLRSQAEELATLNALASTVGQSLDLAQILDTALDKVLELARAPAGWIALWNSERGTLDLAASRGLAGNRLSIDGDCGWPCVLCEQVFRTGQTRVVRHASRDQCPLAIELEWQDLGLCACVPLESKERVLGVMGLASGNGHEESEISMDMPDLLTGVGRQIGIAIENASLYEELRKKEVMQHQLLDRVITAQEEERRRIARELHDQTGQALSSLVMTLEVLGQAQASPELTEQIAELRNLAIKTIDQVHDLALELRPSVLDDLGLLPAIRHYLRGYQDRARLPVEFQAVGLEQHRLPPDVETALYRIMQEALTNVVRHAEAHSVSVLLENRGESVVLIVEDDGRGFDVAEVMGARLHESNLGLYGMRERAALVAGTLTIESTPGGGTAVYAEIPLGGEDANGQDSTVSR